MNIFAALLFVSASSFSAPPAWDLNDVTYLLPLSAIVDPKLEMVGTDFIPKQYLPGTLDVKNPTSVAEMRLVSFRVDPCFQDQFTDACRKQIRAVWQPVYEVSPGAFSTRDGAFHTFYDLSDAEFADFLGVLRNAKKTHGVPTAGLALGVHPGFSNAGFAADVVAALKLRLATNPVKRIAITAVLDPDQAWQLVSFDVGPDGKLYPIIPHGMKRPPQFPEMTAPGSGLLTEPAPFFALTPAEAATLTAEEKSDRAIETALTIENPQKHLPGTVDCLSCHAAGLLKEREARLRGATLPSFASRLGLEKSTISRATPRPPRTRRISARSVIAGRLLA